MTRDQAIEIARECAKAKPQSYYAEPFEPHEWVVDAMIRAGNTMQTITTERDRLQRENDFLRALVGNSDKACVYCGLGAESQGQCVLGFPGCSRGDDQMLCREVGVAIERDELKPDAERYRYLCTERLGRFSRWAPVYDPVNPKRTVKECLDAILDQLRKGEAT